jgi:FMN phosphatase YigB (HAD superfamily)
MQRINIKDCKTAYHVGNSLELDVAGANDAGWNPIRYNEWFDDDFPDWSDALPVHEARKGAEKHLDFYSWGRKDSITGLEWTEIWDLTDILTLFGFPDDDEKALKTTYIRNVRGDV